MGHEKSIAYKLFRYAAARAPRKEGPAFKLNVQERTSTRFYDSIHYPVWYFAPFAWWFEKVIHPFWCRFVYPDKIQVANQRGMALHDLMNTYFTGKITLVEYNVAVMGSHDDFMARHLRLGRARSYMNHMAWTMPKWVSEEISDHFVYGNEEFPFHDTKFSMYAEMTPRPNPQAHFFAKNPLTRISKLFRYGTRLTYNEVPQPGSHRYGSNYTDEQLKEHLYTWDQFYVQKPFHLNTDIPEEKERFLADIEFYKKHTPEMANLWDGNYPTPATVGHLPNAKFDDDGFPLDGRTFEELKSKDEVSEKHYNDYLQSKKDEKRVLDLFEWSLEQGRQELAQDAARISKEQGYKFTLPTDEAHKIEGH